MQTQMQLCYFVVQALEVSSGDSRGLKIYFMLICWIPLIKTTCYEDFSLIVTNYDESKSRYVWYVQFCFVYCNRVESLPVIKIKNTHKAVLIYKINSLYYISLKIKLFKFFVWFFVLITKNEMINHYLKDFAYLVHTDG